MHVIREAVKRISERYKNDANTSARAIARLGVVVAALTGNELREERFLPFPNETDIDGSESSVDLETAIIFLRLMKRGEIPGRVISAAGFLIDEMVKITGTQFDK